MNVDGSDANEENNSDRNSRTDRIHSNVYKWWNIYFFINLSVRSRCCFQKMVNIIETHNLPRFHMSLQSHDTTGCSVAAI